jgi:hypothetical protein
MNMKRLAGSNLLSPDLLHSMMIITILCHYLLILISVITCSPDLLHSMMIITILCHYLLILGPTRSRMVPIAKRPTTAPTTEVTPDVRQKANHEMASSQVSIS